MLRCRVRSKYSKLPVFSVVVRNAGEGGWRLWARLFAKRSAGDQKSQLSLLAWFWRAMRRQSLFNDLDLTSRRSPISSMLSTHRQDSSKRLTLSGSRVHSVDSRVWFGVTVWLGERWNVLFCLKSACGVRWTDSELSICLGDSNISPSKDVADLFIRFWLCVSVDDELVLALKLRESVMLLLEYTVEWVTGKSWPICNWGLFHKYASSLVYIAGAV